MGNLLREMGRKLAGVWAARYGVAKALEDLDLEIQRLRELVDQFRNWEADWIDGDKKSRDLWNARLDERASHDRDKK